MTNIKDVPNYIISLDKDTSWKNRCLVESKDRKMNEQALINNLESNLRFYIKHIY